MSEGSKPVTARARRRITTDQRQQINALRTAARTLAQLGRSGDYEAAALAVRSHRLIDRIERDSVKAGFGTFGVAEADELRKIIQALQGIA